MKKQRPMWKFLISITFFATIFVMVPAFAQSQASEENATQNQAASDTLQNNPKKKTKKDTIKHSLKPSILRLGVDLIGLGKTAFDNNKTEFEFNADIIFYRYFLALDLGYFSVQRGSESLQYDYASSGSFFRVGVDMNFLQKDPDASALFLGARYGRSSFKDNINYSFADANGFLSQEDNFRENTNAGARWFELTAGMKVKIWNQFFLGYTGRFKFGLKSKDADNLEPFDIPGYGRDTGSTYWGFNYYLIYQIPFKGVRQINEK